MTVSAAQRRRLIHRSTQIHPEGLRMRPFHWRTIRACERGLDEVLQTNDRADLE